MCFLLDSKLDFYLKMILFSKQNKKENFKCDSLFWKMWSMENRIRLGGQVTHQEGMVKTIAPL